MQTMPAPGSNGGNAPAMLLQFIQSIEHDESEIAEIKERIKDTKRSAKEYGFDAKVINQLLRERKMDPAELQEHVSLCEVYRASIGMLNGTPLGEGARRRFVGEFTPETSSAPESEQRAEEQGKEVAEAISAEGVEKARQEGRDAAQAGKKILDNPYLFADVRRAAFEEGWVQASGSDGMEIPEAFRRKSAKKPGKKGAE